MYKLTPRENYLELKNKGKPERFVNQYEPFATIFDPLIAMIVGGREMGKDTKDAWGTTIRWKQGEVAGIPYITDETKVLPDITEWKKYVKAPELDVPPEAWDWTKKFIDGIDRKEKFVSAFMSTGLFEQLHYLMGFEDTLMNLLLEPEATAELLDYILDWKMEYAKLLIENAKPEVIISHDDWGAKDRLFMSKETWCELFKPRYAKLYGYIKSQGVEIIHHSDSYCYPIIHDMAEVGIDVWQGILPSNDIPKVQKELGGKMLLMGGLDAGIIDRVDWTEEIVRGEVARACKEYAPGGSFIPCITYGTPEAIYPGVFECITDEIENQSKIYFK